MTFVDSNVLIDILSRDERWFGWSSDQLSAAVAGGGATANLIVVAELSPGYASSVELKGVLAAISLLIAPLDEEVAFEAGHLFARWRRECQGAAAGRVLADFLIGAHAARLNMQLLTRDPAIYRRYFPDLPLITPETDHG